MEEPRIYHAKAWHQKGFPMPIINQNSYISTMAAFAAHWPLVNTAIAPDAVTLQNAYTLANFNTDRAALQAAFDNVQTQNAALGQARNALSAQRTALMKRMEEFRTFLIGTMPNSTYIQLLSATPGLYAIESRFLQPFASMQSIWLAISANPPPGFVNPIKLQGGYLVTAFTTDLTNLKAAFANYDAQKIALRSAIKDRYVLLAPARQRMKQYRAVVKAKLLPTSSLYLSLPRLSPVAGSTPKAVTNLLAVYNSVENSVRLTFSPSVSANIAQYLLQFCPDAKWNSSDVQVIANMLPAPPYAFDFKLNMIEEGQTGLFKVVVRNDTENQKASRVLRIKRTAVTTLTQTEETPQPLKLAA